MSKIETFIEEIKSMTVLELSELVKAIEEEFGVSAAAPVMVAGGAVAGGGIVLYALSKKARGLPVLMLDGIAGVSGIAWCLWIIGFLLFFVAPQYWLLSLFLAACGLLLKVASKVGLIGLLMREDIDKE